MGVHGFWRNGDWKTKAFSGWTLNGTFTANSGTPLTALLGGNLTNTHGIGARRSASRRSHRAAIDAGDYPYFNLLAFTTAAAGQYGDAGRGHHSRPFHHQP